MNDFLPKDYEVPANTGGYMRFEDGSNMFRPLDSVIVGWEGWKTLPDGTRKPVRARTKEEIKSAKLVDEPDKLKHFWAFPVYNYKTGTVQILELTQRTIQQQISDLISEDDWGVPVGVNGYDLVVTRKGEKLDTTYTVMPKPKKKLDEAIMQVYTDMHINLDALYDGNDPFEAAEATEAAPAA